MPTHRLKLPPALAHLAKRPEFDVTGDTVSACLDHLDKQCPGLSDKIRNEQDEPRKHVLVYIDSDEVRDLKGLQTPLKPGAMIYVVAAVSGG